MTTRLFFQAAGSPQHAPLVRGRIGGQDGLFILDTCSTHHILMLDFARDVGLRSCGTDLGTDHAAASVPSEMLEPAAVHIEGTSLPLTDLVGIDAPPPLARMGIAGILSPQHLLPQGVAVLDFVSDRLFLLTGSTEDVVSCLESCAPGFFLLSLERAAEGRIPLVHAAIEPFDAVPTSFNTGGKEVEFSMAAVPGLGLNHPCGHGHGLGGSPVVGSTVTGRTLRLQNKRLAVANLLVRETLGDARHAGDIGMSLLKHTILAVGATGPVWWALSSDRFLS